MSADRHRVLIVDDDPSVREFVKVALSAADDIEVVGEAGDGIEAVELVSRLDPDVVMMDIDMPQLDGPAATERIVRADPDARVLAFTGHIESQSLTRMIVAGAVGYAVKGGDPEDLRESVREAALRHARVDPAAMSGLFGSVVELAREEQARRIEAERLHRELKQSYRETIQALARALRARDRYTHDHEDRVAGLAMEVGRRMGLTERQLSNVEYGAIFHDIGKIGVPDSILHNTDDLTEQEWEIIRQHTVWGEEIIKPVGFLRDVGRIVRHSHEHWNGRGYPDGLAGEDIPLESRIIFACDAFDAMTSQRTYQEARTEEAAIERLRELSGAHFDPAVVDELVTVLRTRARARVNT